MSFNSYSPLHNTARDLQTGSARARHVVSHLKGRAALDRFSGINK